MHREQIILDDWQYERLRSQAEREQKSVSDLVRAVLTDYIEQEARSGAELLDALEGVLDDDEGSGRDHDRILYGLERRRP